MAGIIVRSEKGRSVERNIIFGVDPQSEDEATARSIKSCLLMLVKKPGYSGTTRAARWGDF